MGSTRPRSFRLSQYPAVRRHCQTIAGQTGRPVFLFQTTVVSRWLVMPMAAMSEADAPMFRMACWATSNCTDQISSASCSTQPGLGKNWVNSFWAMLHTCPARSNRMHRLLVVPASRAMIYEGIPLPPLQGPSDPSGRPFWDHCTICTGRLQLPGDILPRQQRNWQVTLPFQPAQRSRNR